MLVNPNKPVEQLRQVTSAAMSKWKRDGQGTGWRIEYCTMRIRLLATLFILGAHQALAQSTIVHVPGPCFWILGYDFTPRASLDMNQDGRSDFSFSASPWICTMDIPTSFCSQSVFVGISATNSILIQGMYAASVPPGGWIGQSAPTNTEWSTGSTTYLCIYWHSPREGTSGARGSIGEQGEGYLGVRFSAADGNHYGWIFVTGQSVMEWAYEMRPNCPIQAGARPVPVPLRKISIQRPGYLRLAAETETGKAYQVQVKASLRDVAWSNLSFALPASSTNTLVDIPLTDRTGVYRVVEAD